MYQLQIEYFWPLTEQIPLDLDYTSCLPKLENPTPIMSADGYTLSFAPNNSNITVTAYSMNIDVDTTTIKLSKKPSVCRRVLYNCLGLKWEIK